MPNLLDSLKHLFRQPSADAQTLAQLADHLEENANPLAKHLRTARDSDANRAQLSRVIGVERWGQACLKVFLGEALVDDTPDAHRPLDHLDWDMLTAQFWATRKDTVALARQLAEADIDDSATVPHPDLGAMTARAWLDYLYSNARKNIRRIR
jgi:hypothetical protein